MLWSVWGGGGGGHITLGSVVPHKHLWFRNRTRNQTFIHTCPPESDGWIQTDCTYHSGVCHLELNEKEAVFHAVNAWPSAGIRPLDAKHNADRFFWGYPVSAVKGALQRFVAKSGSLQLINLTFKIVWTIATKRSCHGNGSSAVGCSVGCRECLNVRAYIE